MKKTLGILLLLLVTLVGQVIGQNETSPECLNLEEVQQKIGYPAEAKRAGIEGKVVAKVTVDATGKVAKSEISESPSQVLSDAVLAQVVNLKFKPARANGQPIKAIVLVPFRFDKSSSDKVYTSLEDALTTTDVVEHLDLSGQKISALDKRVKRLTSLRTIKLADNAFTTIPSVLGKLSALEHIDMSGNKVTAVPGFLKKLKGLVQVNLKGNPVSAEALAKAKLKLKDVELVVE